MKFTNFHNKPAKAASDLNAGLNKRLKADDQFNGFVTIITVAAGEEVKIPNGLRSPTGQSMIPGEWSVIDAAGSPAGVLVRGSTPWTTDFLYLKNTSVDTNGQFKVRFTERPIARLDDASTARLQAPSQPISPATNPSYAVFYGPTTGSQVLPTTWDSPTLSDAVLSLGEAITRSTNDLTLPSLGIWRATFAMGGLDTNSTTTSYVFARVRNITTAATIGKSHCTHFETNDRQHGQHFEMIFEYSNPVDEIEVQWAATNANVFANSRTVDGEASYMWVITLEYLGEG